MAEFKVNEVIDGQTIKTLPNWIWKNRDGKELKGHTVKILGYNIASKPMDFQQIAKTKLESLLLNNYVILKNPTKVDDNGIIWCMVFLNGVDISNYFPESKQDIRS